MTEAVLTHRSFLPHPRPACTVPTFLPLRVSPLPRLSECSLHRAYTPDAVSTRGAGGRLWACLLCSHGEGAASWLRARGFGTRLKGGGVYEIS